jgi:spore coat protein CotF
MDEAKARACREQARKYAEMAGTAATPELRRVFAELAESWRFLADQIEQAAAEERDRAK